MLQMLQIANKLASRHLAIGTIYPFNPGFNCMSLSLNIFKDGPFTASFSQFSQFSSFLFRCTIGRYNYANVGIPTADLWFWKQALYQLNRNHSPSLNLIDESASSPIIFAHT